MSKLTEAQRRNLEHVRDHGQSTPGSRAAYKCRMAGWSVFVWRFGDGKIATIAENPPYPGRELIEVVGERLTEAGRLALAEEGRDNG